LNTQNKQKKYFKNNNFKKKYNLQQTQEGTSNYQNKPTTLQYLSAFFTRNIKTQNNKEHKKPTNKQTSNSKGNQETE